MLFALLAFGLISLVRSLRSDLIERYAPIVVDLVSSVLIVGIVVAVTLAVADLWGQTETLLEQLGVLRIDQRAPELVVSLVVLIAIQVFAGISTRLLDDLTTESEALTKHQREIALRLTQITLWTLGILIILGVWDVDLTGLLVGAGFLGIVIGLASRKTLGSLLGGLVLMFSRPFEVGDWILVDDKEGLVSDITLMSTRIQGFDGEYIVVPNDVVTNKTITNRSRQGRYRITVETGIDYDADVDRAREIALDAIEAVAERHESIRENPSPDIVVRSLGDSSLVLASRVWIDDPTARRVTVVRDDVVSSIKAAFEENDIKIPYPQRELSRRDGSGDVQLTEAEIAEDGDATEQAE